MKTNEQFENTILELGTELWELRQQIISLSEQQEKNARFIKDLRGVLEEKGVIGEEDFDTNLDQLNRFSEIEDGEDFDVADSFSSKRGYH